MEKKIAELETVLATLEKAMTVMYQLVMTHQRKIDELEKRTRDLS